MRFYRVIKQYNKKKKLKKIDYLWLLAANSDIRAGLKDASVDLNNTFLTTVKSLNGFSLKLGKNSKVFFENVPKTIF